MRTFFLAFVLLGLSIVPATAAEKTVSRSFVCLPTENATATADLPTRTVTASADNPEDAKYKAHLEATEVCKKEGQLYRWSGDWQSRGS
jgi:hypothetical protein